MKYIIATIFIFLSGLCVSAQAPGYLGKRIAVDANIHSMASPLAALINEETGFRFRYRLNLHADYAVDRLNSVGIHGDYIAHEYSRFLSGKDDAYAVYDETTYAYKLRMQAFGVHYRKYLKGAIAPTGSYLQLASTFVTGNIQSTHVRNSVSFDRYTGETTTTEIENDPKNGTVSAVVIGVGVGKRVVFADRFTFNFGLNLGLPFFMDSESSPFGVYISSSPHGWDEAKTYVTRNYRFSANLGFGILL